MGIPASGLGGDVGCARGTGFGAACVPGRRSGRKVGVARGAFSPPASSDLSAGGFGVVWSLVCRTTGGVGAFAIGRLVIVGAP